MSLVNDKKIIIHGLAQHRPDCPGCIIQENVNIFD